MKITCLAENTSNCAEVGCEHGLSLYIQTETHNILFDMGQSDLFFQNSQKLGVDISAVDIAILSHGHYDHGGGLEKFFEVNSSAQVYISRYAFEEHYNGADKYIGLAPMLKNSSRFIYTDKKTVIDNSLTLFSASDVIKKRNETSQGLNVKRNGELVPDDFIHEQYLMIEKNGKRILISGCSHNVVIDIAQSFKQSVLIGGFHFSKLELDSGLADRARILNDFDCEYYTCHCTGVEQYEYMKKYMKKLNYISAGQSIIL